MKWLRNRGTVYLLHFASPLRHARHYVGFTAGELAERLSDHAAGTGAKIMRAVRAQGIDFDCVRHWDGVTRAFERRIKLDKNVSRLCPVCTPRKQLQRCRRCGKSGHNRRRCPDG